MGVSLDIPNPLLRYRPSFSEKVRVQIPAPGKQVLRAGSAER